MKSYLFSTLSAALFVVGVSAQLTINTPANVIQCTPVQPLISFVFPGATPDTGVLETFSNITGNSYTFTVNFATGTSLDLSLRDNSGLLAQTAPFTVGSGGSTGCLSSGVQSGTAGTVAVTAASSNPTTAGTTAGTSAGSTPTTTGASKAASSGSSASTSTASKSSSTSNAAMSTGIAYGAAGVLGAIVAAVLV
ncbi:hypothetical protein BJV74DRAFT_882384 [Russula compacta]|nr:hypothetical protein BJV74DRAFT_882384 [Russula compacta]